MKVGDLFKIKVPGRTSQEIIYQAVVITQDSNWVSAKIVHPAYLADRLKHEGVFKIELSTLDIVNLGNPNEDKMLKALYG